MCVRFDIRFVHALHSLCVCVYGCVDAGVRVYWCVYMFMSRLRTLCVCVCVSMFVLECVFVCVSVLMFAGIMGSEACACVLAYALCLCGCSL